MSKELPPAIYLGQSEQSRKIAALGRKVRDRAYEATPERRAYKRAYDKAYNARPEIKEYKRQYRLWKKQYELWGYLIEMPQEAAPTKEQAR